uniref:hypothetical protein n=1 Tax=Streptosarcina costaricana TaxID=2058783 RepID=UPI00286B90C4|nr:hypothetical protein RMD91_pgp035 [Streptosarcina costaricana]WKT08915.1 hypothetical protein [Streptosarcina costaricana]
MARAKGSNIMNIRGHTMIITQRAIHFVAKLWRSFLTPNPTLSLCIYIFSVLLGCSALYLLKQEDPSHHNQMTSRSDSLYGLPIPVQSILLACLLTIGLVAGRAFVVETRYSRFARDAQLASHTVLVKERVGSTSVLIRERVALTSSVEAIRPVLETAANVKTDLSAVQDLSGSELFNVKLVTNEDGSQQKVLVPIKNESMLRTALIQSKARARADAGFMAASDKGAFVLDQLDDALKAFEQMDKEEKAEQHESLPLQTQGTSFSRSKRSDKGKAVRASGSASGSSRADTRPDTAAPDWNERHWLGENKPGRIVYRDTLKQLRDNASELCDSSKPMTRHRVREVTITLKRDIIPTLRAARNTYARRRTLCDLSLYAPNTGVQDTTIFFEENIPGAAAADGAGVLPVLGSNTVQATANTAGKLAATGVVDSEKAKSHKDKNFSADCGREGRGEAQAEMVLRIGERVVGLAEKRELDLECGRGWRQLNDTEWSPDWFNDLQPSSPRSDSD